MAIVDAPGETEGRTFAAGMRLSASVPMAVIVSLGRLGSAKYEGASVRVRLDARQPRHVRFTARFLAMHPALKLQVYVDDMGLARDGDLVADSFCVEEIPAGLAEDFTGGKLDFRTANRLLRDGRNAEAAVVYDLLFAENPLRIYRDNAWIARAAVDDGVPGAESLGQTGVMESGQS